MSLEAGVLFEFGKFRCDPREHRLLCEGEAVPLAPKCFDLLVIFLQSKGRLLTKDDLMRQLWPDSFVEEANLTVNISALRKALGETRGQRYIETVPKLGYRFAVPVTEHLAAGTPAARTDQSIAVAAAPAIKPEIVQQETRRPESRSRRWWPVAVLLVLAAIVTAVLIWRDRRKFTDKDTIVLAEFANATGDPVFDGALRQGLSAQLEQSPYLNLLSDERIAQTLSLMARPRDARLTHDLAREVCQRTGSTAVLDATIAQVGTQYLLALRATNCSNGDSLGSAEEQAADKNHVLDALGKLASKIRNQLGESLASVQKYDAPAESVTTQSLEALKSYSLGYRAQTLRGDYAAAIPLFQRSIALDPNFAMAYARLGTMYWNLSDTVQGSEYVRKAYELRGRASEREKFYIVSHYHIMVTGDLEAARRNYELSAQTYPHDIPLNNLGLIYSELGDFNKALEAFQNVLRVSAGTGSRYANLVTGYTQLNRLEEAKAAAREAQSHGIDSPELHLSLYWVYFLEHNPAGMAQEAAQLIGKPGHEDKILNYEADTALYGGQLGKSRSLTQQAIDSAEKAGEKEAVALYRAEAGLREALVGYPDAAKQHAEAALAMSHARDVGGLAAISLQIAGDPGSANRLAADLEKRFPNDTIAQSNYLPAIRAAALWRNADPAKATAALSAKLPYELGGNLETVNFVLYPVYLRGVAYLSAKQGAPAAAEFQKILNHAGAVRSEPIGALSHLQMGRALVLIGDNARARSSYEEFFAIWKDADPDIPILKQAKTEYAALNPAK